MDISLARFQQVRTDQKLGVSPGQPGGIAERPASKSLGGRAVGWLHNLSPGHRAEKREIMQSFQARLKQDYGDTIGGQAFAATIGTVKGKSLSGGQIQAAIALADQAQAQVMTANLGQIARHGPGGDGFLRVLAGANLLPSQLSDAAKTSIREQLVLGSHQDAAGAKPLSRELLGASQVKSTVQNLARTEVALTDHLPGGGAYARVAQDLKIDVHDIDPAKLTALLRDAVHADGGHGQQVPTGAQMETRLKESFLAAMSGDATLRPAVDAYHARQLPDHVAGGPVFNAVLGELGVDPSTLSQADKDDIRTKIEINVSHHAGANGATALAPERLRELARNAVADHVATMPYLPGGVSYDAAVQRLGLRPDQLDAAELRAALVDRYQGNTSSGTRINSQHQLDVTLEREVLGEAVKGVLGPVKAEPAQAAALRTLEGAGDRATKKAVASTIEIRVNLAVDGALKSGAVLGPGGIADITRGVIQGLVKTQAGAEAASSNLVRAMTRTPLDGEGFAKAMLDIARHGEHIGVGPDDTREALSRAFRTVLAGLDTAGRDALFAAVLSPEFRQAAQDFAGSVNHAGEILMDQHAESSGAVPRLNTVAEAMMGVIGTAAQAAGRADVEQACTTAAADLTDPGVLPRPGPISDRLQARALATENVMDTLLELQGDRDLDAGGADGRAAQNIFVAMAADMIDSRLLTARAKGVETPADTIQTIRQEIQGHASADPVLVSKALSVLDKAEAQIRAEGELAQAPAFRDFPPAGAWKMLMDGHLQAARGEYGFENEQGYMAGMLNGLSRMLESVRNQEPLDAALFQTLHDTSVDKVYSKPTSMPEFAGTPMDGSLKKGYRTDDGSNVGVGFPFKPVRDEGGVRQGTVTPEGRRELEARVGADPWYSIDIGHGGAPDKLWCGTKSASQCSARVDGIADAYRREIAAAVTEDQKLLAIARCCQDLDQSHVFEDGNIRTVSFLVMNKLLVENGLSPAILHEPNVFDGFSHRQLVDEIRAGQATFAATR